MRILCLAALLVANLVLSGCGGTYLLTTKFVMSSQKEVAPEIVETPTYRSIASNVKTVAVKAPDSCSNRTADERTGVAVSQEAVLKTTCGVEMAEIERALSKASYKVISWKVLAREMEGKDISALDVAAKLGAQLLFQINSLEKSTRTLGKDARWERTFYTSNEYGDAINEQAFDEVTRAFLRHRYLDSYESSVDLKRLAVTLDANAVQVKDGESIWFYRWTLTDPAEANYQKKQLVYYKNTEKSYLLRPQSHPDSVKTDTITSGESEAVSITEKPEDLERAIYNSLLKSIVDNLVSSFARTTIGTTK